MRFVGFAMIGLLLACAWCSAQNPPATGQTARGVVEKVMREVLAVLRDPNLTTAQKSEKVRTIADEEIDFETLARLSMGRFWRDLSEQQRADFVKEFKEHVSATHGHLVDEYGDEEVTVTGDRQEQRDDWTVQSKILGMRDGARKEVAKVDYRLRQKDGRWKIIDVTIDGVSMVGNFRAQFQDIMPNGGFERALKLLRDKNLDRNK